MKLLASVLVLAMSLSLATPVVVARVQDGETKLALAGAMVTSEGSDIMAVTDAAGQCVVVAAPKRGGTLLASRTGYFDLRLPWSPPAGRAPDTVKVDLLLYPDRPRVVVGRVYDAGAGFAILGAKVLVAGTGLADSVEADGSFFFDNFPAGPQSLQVFSPGYPSKSFSVEAKGGETTNVNAALVDTSNVGSVEGVVSDAVTGLPIRDAQVAVEGAELRVATDSVGHYVIENVPAGIHRLLVSRDGYVKAYTVVRFVKDWSVTVNLYLREAAPAPSPVK